MTADPLGHLDEDGRPCALHAAADVDAILSLAVLGTRHSSFNHDIASKLQGMMMSLDEILEAEPITDDPDLRRAAEGAMTAARDLGKLLNVNRALAKTAMRSKVPLAELIAQAGERAGVAIRGDIVEARLEVSVASLAQALALVIDVAAGPGRGRWLAVTTAVGGAAIEIGLAVVTPAPVNASELVALAVSVLRREGGELRCSARGDRIVVRLPAI